MIVKEKDLREIEELVKAHCTARGLKPKGYRLLISVTLESEFQVTAMTGVTIPILKEDPRVLWNKDRSKVPFYGVRILNILENSGLTTMYSLVTMKGGEILKYRNSGKKCMIFLEEWLQEYGLKFGMIFPEDIAKEFPPIKRRHHDIDDEPLGLADLIAQNIEED